MDNLAPLVRPTQSTVSINPTAQDCTSDGFEYPTFRQLNKRARIYISQPWELEPSVPYDLFVAANHHGWSVAVKTTAAGSELAFFQLSDLRAAFVAASPDSEDIFTPARTLPLPGGKINILALSQDDSRLFIGSQSGLLAVFDTNALFSPGSGDVAPLHSLQLQNNAFRQILPNPSSEQGLNDLVAVVGDGKVYLLTTSLESRGGWAATDSMSQPNAASWSPKGKQIAIGLRAGDILTFTPSNLTTPAKHIPPTSNASLVSLNWLGPGHTFRTSYASEGGNPQQHIVSLDTKTSTAVYFEPDHPFPTHEHSPFPYILQLPKWDEPLGTKDHTKSLLLVGDMCSVDLEVLGHIGSQWYRSVQDNPLALPLSKSMDDTVILAMTTDLTDAVSSTPILYVYLNDGSLQAWYLDHSRPYPGMITPGATSTQTQDGSEAKDSTMVADQLAPPSTVAAPSQPTPSVGFGFGQKPPQPAFGSSGFGSATAQPAFGQTGFGTSSGGGGFSAFASSSPSPFGQASNTSTTSPFGQTNNTTTPSAFGQPSKPTGFGAFSSGNSAFGSLAPSSTSVFGSSAPTSGGAFGNLASTTTNVFGQGSFGAPVTNNAASEQPKPASNPISVFGQGSFAAPSTSSAQDMTREASMSDSTPSFGGFGLGSATPLDPNKTSNSMFGGFGTPSSQPTTSAFGSTSNNSSGGLLKPASGFGAFAGLGENSPFGQKKDTSGPASIFSSTSTNASTTSTASAASAFGQTGFGSQPTTTTSAFGQSSFGSSAFGKPAFGQPSLAPASTTTAPASGGFAAFAGNKAAFGGASTNSTSPFAAAAGNNAPATKPTGFSAFASTAPSAFGTAATNTVESKLSPFGAVATPSSFGPSSASPFGDPAPAAPKDAPKPPSPTDQPAAPTSVFGTKLTGPTTPAPALAPQTSSSSSGSSDTVSKPAPATTPAQVSPTVPKQKPLSFSPPSSPEPSSPPPDGRASPTPTPAKNSAPLASGGAFSNLQTSPSPFHLTSGFGAFGSTTPSSSPFFKKPTTASPGVSIFATTPETTPTEPPTGNIAFGAKSQLGATTPVSVFATLGSTKSPPASTTAGSSTTTPTATPAKGGFGAFSSSAGGSSPFATFAAQQKTTFTDLLKVGDKDSKDPTKTSPGKEKKVQEDASYGTLSTSSTSSFVHVSGGEDGEEGEESREAGEDHADEDEEEGEFTLTDEEDYEDDVPPEDGSGEEEEEDEEEEEEEEATATVARSPAAVPLPISRSPSATPQPDAPAVTLTPSPTGSGSGSPAAASRESSSTPPSSPTTGPKEGKPIASPVPSSPFGGLGVGRPSTRPTRSSPLANAISGDESDEDDKGPAKAAAPIPGTAGAESPTNTRPKTPPLLSSFAAPPLSKSPSLQPIQPPTLAPVAPKPGTSLPFSFNISKPATSAPGPPSSVFSPPPGPGVDRPASAPTFGFGSPSQPPPTTNVPSSSTDQPPKPGAFSGFGTTSSPFGLKPFSAPPPAGPASGTPAPTNMFGTAGTTPQQGQFSLPATGTSLFDGARPASAPLPISAPSFVSAPPMAAVGSAPGAFSLVNRVAPGGAASAALAPPAIPAGPSLAEQMKDLQDGMQKECLNIVRTAEEEFKQASTSLFRQPHLVAAVIEKLRKDISQRFISFGGSKDRADLLSRQKWNFADLKQYGALLPQYERDLEEIYAQLDNWRLSLRDVQNGMLKATTRREEVARFHKAKNDEDFAKMLRGRTLGPEHSETQIQLRKSIRAIKDRVQKLEGTLQENKRKLASAASGKAVIRAPTLDTVNRTYRNIDAAIRQQADDISQLTERIAKLDFADYSSLQTPPRDARLPDHDSARRPYNVTPTVAMTTAAALNAEHSAHRLKKALLTVRKQPLMNTKAASAPPPLNSVQTPQKPSFLGVPLDADSTPLVMPEFKEFPTSDEFNPNGSFASSGHRKSAGDRHPTTKRHSTVTPKRSGGNGLWSGVGTVTPPSTSATLPSSSSAGFDWGPLAKVTPTTPSPTNLPRAFVPLSGFTSPTPAKK